jgi:hypothetical protein
MPDTNWQTSAIAALDDAGVVQEVEARFREIRDALDADALGNPALPVLARAVRRNEGWCVFLVLTPWMLARVFLPQESPALRLPSGWDAIERAGESYQVIGPAVDLVLSTGTQRAHINYDPVLGHYLVQPLVQAMAQFDSAEAVFGAWNTVIATRDRVMAEQQRDCPWQREVSRREFFSRLMRA